MFELWLNGECLLTFASYYEAFNAYGVLVYNLDKLPTYPKSRETEVKLISPNSFYSGMGLMYRR